MFVPHVSFTKKLHTCLVVLFGFGLRSRGGVWGLRLATPWLLDDGFTRLLTSLGLYLDRTRPTTAVSIGDEMVKGRQWGKQLSYDTDPPGNWFMKILRTKISEQEVV